MRLRFAAEPSEYVIWLTSALLAVLLGLGTAFFLWATLHRLGPAALCAAGAGVLGLALAFFGLARRHGLARLMLALFTAAALIGVLAGSPAFARLG